MLCQLLAQVLLLSSLLTGNSMGLLRTSISKNSPIAITERGYLTCGVCRQQLR